MFFHTDTADAPWTVIKSDDKKRARLNALRFLLHSLPYEAKDRRRASASSTRCWSAARTSSTSAARKAPSALPAELAALR